jgi:hypothetical protein
MNSERRIMQQMAGLRDSPNDRHKKRQQRRDAKLVRQSEQRIKLIEQIAQREQQVPGFRMMPFANLGKK